MKGDVLADYQASLIMYVEQIIPSFLHDRLRKDAGRMQSKAEKASRGRQYRIDVVKRTVKVSNTAMGLGEVSSFIDHQAGKSTYYSVCLGDLSCSFAGNAHGLCIHVEAFSSQVPFTHDLRKKYALALGQEGVLIVADDAGMLVTVPSKANEKVFRFCNVQDKYCSCSDWELHGLCCHMIAVRDMFTSMVRELPDLDVTGMGSQAMLLSPLSGNSNHVDKNVEDPVVVAKQELDRLKAMSTQSQQQVAEGARVHLFLKLQTLGAMCATVNRLRFIMSLLLSTGKRACEPKGC